MVIGISGGSGSGKTTFARKLLAIIGEKRALILGQDHYYRDRSQQFKKDPFSVNFDDPESVDFNLMTKQLKALKKGKLIECPRYDFKTHTRSDKKTKLRSKPIVIVEGILIFSNKILFKELDLTFFMDAREEVRLERRIRRDVRERGRLEKDVRAQFLRQVKPMHDKYIEPTKKIASYVIET